MFKNAKYEICIILSIVIFYIILSTFSCKNKNESDYRDYFIGNYTFFARTYITTEQDSTYLDTSWNYNGSITKGEFSNTIYIQYFPSLKLIATLKNNGVVINGFDSTLYGGFEGTNKIRFILRSQGFPILSTKTDSVSGIKK